MFEVEVDDFGEGVNFCGFELPYEFCEAIFELRVYVSSVSHNVYDNWWLTYRQ